MNIFMSQLGLENLSEEEKLEFIKYLNDRLSEDDSGSVKPIEGVVVKKGILSTLAEADTIIDIITYTFKVAKNAKRLPYFYKQAQAWLKKKGKNPSPDYVKKMADFLDESTKDINKDAK
jgi:hypothetical protein